MGWLQVFRLAVLYSTTFLSLPTLVLSLHLISLKLPSLCTSISLSAAIVTFVTLPIIVILDHVRGGKYTSLIIVEVFYLSLLWTLWLSAAGTTATFLSNHTAVCNTEGARCSLNEVELVLGFAIVACVLPMTYTITLLLKSVMVYSTGPTEQRPLRIWTATVRDNFSPPRPRVSFLRTSYSPSTLDLFSIKADDDPFHRTPSFRASEAIRTSMLQESSAALAPITPTSASFLQTSAPSPLIRPPTPMYPDAMQN